MSKNVNGKLIRRRIKYNTACLAAHFEMIFHGRTLGLRQALLAKSAKACQDVAPGSSSKEKCRDSRHSNE
jgi:hypothetical protein